MAGHVSVRCGIPPWRFLRMALRLGLEPDGVTLAMLVVDGATAGPKYGGFV